MDATNHVGGPVNSHSSRCRDEQDSMKPDTSNEVGEVRHQWAVSTRSGRPHPKDEFELILVKNERVRILQDMGRNWFLAANRQNAKGWVHGSWLKFGDTQLSPKRPQADTRAVFVRFEAAMKQLQKSGGLHSFPVMTNFINVCSREGCQLSKKSDRSIGICAHDLKKLLQGSGHYSKEWLKDERNIWHPDRFARFCRPEHVEYLRSQAEQMFVLYGVLMDEESA